jgi:hypothetical protein
MLVPRRARTVCASFLTAALCGSYFFASAAAQTIWTGPATSFAKESNADYTLPENQDVLTENVVLTRGDTGGLINYAMESSYVHFVSPVDTLWATDINNDPAATISAANHASLTFTSWIEAYGGQFTSGNNIVGRDAVVHLVTDNIVLDLTFTNWVNTRGGGFAYTRSTPAAVIVPTGDYNNDGFVNAADYVVWRNSLGNDADPQGSGADGDGDGMIGPGDYLFWKEHYGEVVGDMGAGAATGEVPEPGAFGLALLSLSLSLPRARRRRPSVTSNPTIRFVGNPRSGMA